MLNNKTKIILLLCFVALFAIILWLAGGNSTNGKQKEIYYSDKWNTRFELDKKDPLDLYAFNSILRAYIEPQQKIEVLSNWKQHDSLLHKSKQPTYLFIGENLELLNSELDSLLSEVEQGSDLVLSFYQMGSNIYQRFFYNPDYEYDYCDSVVVYAGKQYFTMYSVFQNDTVASKWEGFFAESIIDSNFEILSSFMEIPNFIHLKKGKGNIYLHSNPEFFYNYQVLSKDGFSHAQYFIQQMKKDQPVHWLEFGKTYEYVAKNKDENNANHAQKKSNYLELFLKYPPLFWALIVSVIGIVLYFIFRTKRMQPQVPVLNKKRNLTTPFAEIITSIYYQNHSTSGMLKVIRKNFYDAVQKHFYIDLSKKDEGKEIYLLQEKSNYPLHDLENLIAKIENKEAIHVDEKYLKEVAQLKRDFYLKTGIISSFVQRRILKKEIVVRRVLWYSFSFILMGIIMLLFGLDLLIKGQSLGILFWPISIILAFIGIMKLVKPIAKIIGENLEYISFIKSKKYLFSDILKIEKTKQQIVITLPKSEKIKIKLWEISPFDKSDLFLFIDNFKNNRP